MSDSAREFEIRLAVALQTHGGEPLGEVTDTLVLRVEGEDLAAAEDGATIDVDASACYFGQSYAFVLPLEVAWLRDPGLRTVTLSVPVKVAPIAVDESVAAREDGSGGGRLAVTRRHYRTTTGRVLVAGSTVRTR